MSEELQRYEPHEPEGQVVQYHPLPPPSLFGTSDPVEVVAKASRVAEALKSVISKQGLISKISGKEYPRCEAWTLLGTMLGVFPVLVWTRPVEGGWEARVEAKTRDGSIVGAAEAQCLKTERNWSSRDDFALRSMAQTRATAKALRMPLGFVMTLSGIEPTPAEEMTFEQKPERTPRGTSATPATPTSTATRPAQADKPAPVATEEQRQRWIAKLKTYGQAALEYCYDRSWLLPRSDNFPGEPIETLKIEHVPTMKSEADEHLAEIRAIAEFAGLKVPAETPQQPATEQRELVKEIIGDEPEQSQDDGVETMVGLLDKISEKSGTSSKGKWTRFGLCVAGQWFSTFNAVLVKSAGSLKGHSVRVFYKVGERGNDLVGIERART